MLTLLLAVNTVWGTPPLDLATRVRVIGVRPGEKQHEQLIHANESLHTLIPLTVPYYQILPAIDMPKQPPEPFEYRSDTAQQLDVPDLVAMLRDE